MSFANFMSDLKNKASGLKDEVMKFKNKNFLLFKTAEVIGAFKEYVDNFEFDQDIGESKAYEAINRLRGNEVECRTVMRLILSIAAADGVFDDDEKSVAKKIAIELGLDPSDFEL